MQRIKDFIKVTLMIGVCIVGITLMYIYEGKANTPRVSVTQPPDTIPVFMDRTAKDGLIDALNHYDIYHADIVYAQALLETGHFKSVGCLKHNNLFGLYNSKAGSYHRFDHWTESVVAYKEWIQRRYKPPEDYYHFLQRIGYAEDPQYINKLRKIVKYESKSSKGDSLKRDSTVTRK